jgi:DNA-directed RNA polymerase specialized sigma subunit
MSHVQIALELGISHQRVSQIEQSALKKLRAALFKNNITYEELFLCLKHS